MPNFNKRIFGSDIDPKIKNKLIARQALADSAIPNESIQFTEVGGKQINLEEAIGKNHNFKSFGDREAYLAELSSRTPWARAWVAVEIYRHHGKISTKKEIEFTPAHVEHVRGEGTGMFESSYSEFVGDKYKVISKEIGKEKTDTMEKKVYVLGDNNYHSFLAKNKPNNPIQEASKGILDVTKGLGLTTGVTAESIFPGQMQNNPFNKPPAGITSIETKTEGFAGAIRHTTVNFVVHNFEDFQNIYARFFLKPGATVIVDFGWDTSVIYSPQEYSGGDIRDGIYGNGGPLDNSAGDLEIIIGKVSDFTSTTDENGSFICSMTIVSDNAGLVDYEISDKNKLKSLLVDNLSTTIINKVASRIGASFLRKDWTSDESTAEESRTYANTFANALFGGERGAVISPEAVKAGIYWQSLGTERISTQESALGGESWFSINLSGEQDIIQSTRADAAISDANNLYISWAFFEEEVLNDKLGFVSNDDDFFGSSFNSTDSFIAYELNLLQRQSVDFLSSRKKTGLKFLYPSHTGWNETYHTINHKNKVISRPEVEGALLEIGGINILDITTTTTTSEDGISGVTSLDQKANRIPLRELFINVDLIKEAFSNNSNVSEAIIEILDVLNEESMNVFNLKLMSATRDDSSLAVVDSNYYNSSYDELAADKFKNLFIFHPYSKGSIVKEMSLTYKTPNNSLQTMIAIQNKSAGIPLFPLTEMEDNNQALRSIYQILDKENTQFGIRHLPTPYTDKKSNQSKDAEKSQQPIVSKDLLEDNTQANQIIQQYQDLHSKAIEFEAEEGEVLLRDANDNTDNQRENPKEYPHIDGEDDPPELLDPDAFYAKDIEEYFEYLCKKDFVHRKPSPLIPIELTLTTYGISGILPGNIFNVDYLPAQYRDRTYFQVMNVEHSVDNTGWKTTFQTQMRVRHDNLIRGLFQEPNIYLSTQWLTRTGVNPLVRQMFKNFKLDSTKTGNGVLVFEAQGRKKGTYSPGKSFGTVHKNSWVGPEYFNGTGPNSPHAGKGYGQYFGNINIEFQKGHKTPRYIIVVLAGGAYAFDRKQISLDIVYDGLSAKERIDLIKDALFNFVTNGKALEQSWWGGEAQVTPASQ